MEYWYSETLDCWLIADENGKLLAGYGSKEELLADYPSAVLSTEMGDTE